MDNDGLDCGMLFCRVRLDCSKKYQFNNNRNWDFPLTLSVRPRISQGDCWSAPGQWIAVSFGHQTDGLKAYGNGHPDRAIPARYLSVNVYTHTIFISISISLSLYCYHILTTFSLYCLVTPKPSFRWAAAVMHSPTVRYSRCSSIWCMYAERLRNVCELVLRPLPLTSTFPVTPVSLQAGKCCVNGHFNYGRKNDTIRPSPLPQNKSKSPTHIRPECSAAYFCQRRTVP